MQLIYLDCEIGFDTLDHEILANGFELIAYVRIITFGTPFLFQEFEGFVEDFGGTDDAWVGGGGEAEVRPFEDLGTAYERLIIW